jgi:hypothetical protein
VSNKAATPRCGGNVDNEKVLQSATRKLAGQGKVQRPLHLSAELVGLLLYPAASVSLSVFGFLQGSFEFGIDHFGRNLSFASAFRHGNSLPRTHAVKACDCAPVPRMNAGTVSLEQVEAVGARSDGPEKLPASG